jgi:hypothetical protein
MTLAWIAAHLFMGAPTHVACLLHRKNRSEQNSENTILCSDPAIGYSFQLDAFEESLLLGIFHSLLHHPLPPNPHGRLGEIPLPLYQS